MLFNTADAVLLGDTPAQAVYLGDTKVWPSREVWHYWTPLARLGDGPRSIKVNSASSKVEVRLETADEPPVTLTRADFAWVVGGAEFWIDTMRVVVAADPQIDTRYPDRIMFAYDPAASDPVPGYFANGAGAPARVGVTKPPPSDPTRLPYTDVWEFAGAPEVAPTAGQMTFFYTQCILHEQTGSGVSLKAANPPPGGLSTSAFYSATRITVNGRAYDITNHGILGDNKLSYALATDGDATGLVVGTLYPVTIEGPP